MALDDDGGDDLDGKNGDVGVKTMVIVMVRMVKTMVTNATTSVVKLKE